MGEVKNGVLERRFTVRMMIEILLALFIAATIILRMTHSIKLPSDYGKRLQQGDAGFGNRSFPDYIEEIKSFDNGMAIFAVKDIQGYSLLQEDIDALQSLGFDQAYVLLNREYHSFIGIWKGGGVIYQCVGGDEEITYEQSLDGHSVYVRSATLTAGNTADICVDGINYAVNGRGMNIVTVNNDDFELVDSVAYDFFVEEVPVYRLVEGEDVFIAPTRGGGGK